VPVGHDDFAEVDGDSDSSNISQINKLKFSPNCEVA